MPAPAPRPPGSRAGQGAFPDADATRQSFLTRLREMDPDGWEELYRRYRQMILTRAQRAGLNDADADDVVQNVFTAIARNPPGPSPRPGAFRAWLREQTRWRITDKLRENGRLSLATPPPTQDNPTPNGPLETLAADDEFARQWDSEFVRHVQEIAERRVARQVSPEHFQVYQLNVEQGWPAGKVARQFNLATATVYVIRHRVGSRLRAEVETLLQELDEGGLLAQNENRMPLPHPTPEASASAGD